MKIFQLARRWQLSMFVSVSGVLVVALLVSGCGIVDLGPPSTAIVELGDKTVPALDDAINALEDSSADWQVVLQDLMSKLTDSAQSTIRNEISDLLSRGIAATGAEFRCNVDFIRIRARQALINIKAKLLGLQVQEIEPQLCDVVPLAVDRALVPDRLNKLEFYGYDFDTLPIQVILKETNREVDVSSKLDRPTHYHMTLNLGSNGVQFSSQSQRLVLKWQNKEISTIAVIQPTTPICKDKIVEARPGKITFIPSLTRGDREFGGNGPKVWVRVAAAKDGNQVMATIEMSAEETKGNWTTAYGITKRVIYTPDPGWRVEKVISELQSEFNYVDNDHSPDIFELGTSGPVKRLEIVGDGEGADVERNTKVTIDFNAVRIELVETENCVSRSAITNLKLGDFLDLKTLKRFEREPNLLNQPPVGPVGPVSPREVQ